MQEGGEFGGLVGSGINQVPKEVLGGAYYL